MIKKWIKKFNEKLHKANEDDRGSAFVMVVIGVMATAIIGATVLSLATNYFVSVLISRVRIITMKQRRSLQRFEVVLKRLPV